MHRKSKGVAVAGAGMVPLFCYRQFASPRGSSPVDTPQRVASECLGPRPLPFSPPLLPSPPRTKNQTPPFPRIPLSLLIPSSHFSPSSSSSSSFFPSLPSHLSTSSPPPPPSIAVLNAHPPFSFERSFLVFPIESACGWTPTCPPFAPNRTPATRNDQTSQRTPVVDTPTEPVRAHSGNHTTAVYCASRLRRSG